MEKKSSSPLLSIIIFNYYFNWFVWYFSFSFAFNTFPFSITSLIWFLWFYFLCKRRNCFEENHSNSAIKILCIYWFSQWKYMVIPIGFQIFSTRLKAPYWINIIDSWFEWNNHRIFLFTVSVYKSEKNTEFDFQRE